MVNKLKQFGPFFNDDEDARACKDIDENACKVVQGNFWLMLLSQFFSKLADALASAKIVLPWVMQSIGAPVFLSGLLVPIRESGSLIPQIILGGIIRRFALRKPFYIVGSLLQGCCTIGMIWVLLNLQSLIGGLSIIGLLIIFSLSRGLCSIASKDVLGKTIPKNQRGSLSGYAATAAGLMSIGVGVVLIADLELQKQLPWLLTGAAICWFLSASSYLAIKEYHGATEGGENAWAEALKSAKLLKTDAQFRQFILMRSLLMSSGLSAPYFIIMAQQSNGADSTLMSLGLFIVVSGLASFISASIWGKLADHSSRNVLLISASLVALLCLSGGVISLLKPNNQLWYVIGLYFLLAITHQGVRLGRKTYLVNMASGNQRTSYVAVSNSFIGILLLLVGLFSALLAQISLVSVFLGFALCAATAVVIGFKMKEV